MATEEQIRELAYSIWEKEGRPQGKDIEHYFRAKEILEEQEITSSAARVQILPVLPLQPPSVSKPAERRTVKRRSKKS